MSLLKVKNVLSFHVESTRVAPDVKDKKMPNLWRWVNKFVNKANLS